MGSHCIPHKCQNHKDNNLFFCSELGEWILRILLLSILYLTCQKSIYLEIHVTGRGDILIWGIYWNLIVRYIWKNCCKGIYGRIVVRVYMEELLNRWKQYISLELELGLCNPLAIPICVYAIHAFPICYPYMCLCYIKEVSCHCCISIAMAFH